jgi:hypothetical protein
MGKSQNKNESGICYLLVFLFFLLLISLNVYRILNIPATYDEVCFYQFLDSSYSDIVNLRMIVSANIHLLNFVLTKFFTETFGQNLFFLRLGSLLAQIIYLTAAWLICAKVFKNKWWQFALFIAFNLNPFLFDFWGLSRGYAMSIALMLASVYFLLSYREQRKMLPLVLSLTMALASVYSSFSLLNFYLAIVGTVLFDIVILSPRTAVKQQLFKATGIIVAISWCLYQLIVTPVQKLIDANSFYHGGEKGFFTDTLRSVVKESLFQNYANGHSVSIVSWTIVATVIASGSYWLVMLLRKKANIEAKTGILLWLILMTPVTTTVVQHQLYQTRFLTDRTALFFYPLYIAALLYWLWYILGNHTKIAISTISVIIGFITYNFLSNFSLSSSWEWAYDKNSIVILDKIKVNAGSNRQASLKATWMFLPSLKYHIKHGYQQYLDDATDAYLPLKPEDTLCDYYYVTEQEMHFLKDKYDVDTIFTVRNTDVYEGKYVLMKKRTN